MKKEFLLILSFLIIAFLISAYTSQKAKEYQSVTVTKAVMEKEKKDGTEKREETDNSEEGSVQEYTAEGYVLSSEEDSITVDLEKSGARNYPEEGKDRGVKFDISNAEVLLLPSSTENLGEEPVIRAGLTVSLTYRVENGNYVASRISTDNDEKEMITYISAGKAEEILDKKLTVSISEGELAGERITFDTSEAFIPESLAAGSMVEIHYYLKEDSYSILSITVLE